MANSWTAVLCCCVRQVTGKAMMLDEIINYVRSLQLQVEVKHFCPHGLPLFVQPSFLCYPWSSFISRGACANGQGFDRLPLCLCPVAPAAIVGQAGGAVPGPGRAWGRCKGAGGPAAVSRFGPPWVRGRRRGKCCSGCGGGAAVQGGGWQRYCGHPSWALGSGGYRGGVGRARGQPGAPASEARAQP